MKWLIILGLILVVIVLIATRYRQQIKMVIYVWRMFRKMHQATKSPEKQLQKQENETDSELIRCAKCGTWVQRNKALKLRSGVNFCSTVCLESAVKVN